jgi:hypothetical protein
MKIKNNKKNGLARIIILKIGKKYKAICLDFDIIEEADTRDIVEKSIKEAIIGYVQNICKNNLDDKLLNRSADEKYWKIYREYLKKIEKQKINSDVDETSIFTLPIDQKKLCIV